MKLKKFRVTLFKAAVIIKGIDGTIEMIAGFFLFFGSNFISGIIRKIFEHELSEEPSDVIANFLINAAQNISLSSQHFIALYLLIHGLIKMSIVYALLKKIMWAYLLSLVILSLLIIFQVARFCFTHSVILLFFTLIDAVIVILIRKEYIRLTNI